jgi:hypothetical protein
LKPLLLFWLLSAVQEVGLIDAAQQRKKKEK